MNPTDGQLNRLFKAAAQAPATRRGAGKFRDGGARDGRAGAPRCAAENGDMLFVMWFRRATIGACLLALVSLALNYHELTNSEKGISDELALADSAMQKGLNP